MNGKIKFFVLRKGYGFIKSDEDDSEIFFHINDFIDKIETNVLFAGDAVEYEIEKGSRGDKAVKIKKKK